MKYGTVLIPDVSNATFKSVHIFFISYSASILMFLNLRLQEFLKLGWRFLTFLCTNVLCS